MANPLDSAQGTTSEEHRQPQQHVPRFEPQQLLVGRGQHAAHAAYACHPRLIGRHPCLAFNSRNAVPAFLPAIDYASDCVNDSCTVRNPPAARVPFLMGSCSWNARLSFKLRSDCMCMLLTRSFGLVCSLGRKGQASWEGKSKSYLISNSK